MAGSDWISHLPLVMLGLRSAPKDNSGFSPAEAVCETNFSLPGEFIKHSEFFSGRLNVPYLGSLDLLDIMWSSLNLSLYRENFSLLSSFLSEMMPQNLLYLRYYSESQ